MKGEPMNTRAFLLASLIAGVVLGLLGGLPIISIANCVLCIWVWLGAILAVWLYRRFAQPQPAATLGQGALIGLVSGLVGAVVVRLISLVTRGAPTEAIAQIFEAAGVQAPSFLASGVAIVGFLIDVVLYAIFGVVGGLIGASIFKDKAPAPVASVVPPPAPYQAPAAEVPPPAAPEEPEAPTPEPPAQDNP
jgi:hypothetical protein